MVFIYKTTRTKRERLCIRKLGQVLLSHTPLGIVGWVEVNVEIAVRWWRPMLAECICWKFDSWPGMESCDSRRD